MLDIRTTGSGTVSVKVRGELDMTQAPSLRSAITALLNRRDVTGVDLDLADVSMIDATGLGTLVVAHRIATNLLVQLRLTAVSAPVAQLLILAGAGDLVPVAEPAQDQAHQPRTATGPPGPAPVWRSLTDVSVAGRARRAGQEKPVVGVAY